MALQRASMRPLPTSQHISNSRTDDDIDTAVSNFLSSEGQRLHGKTWQDTTAEVTKWLAIQIQLERDGWMHTTRAAMQEIESHRKEVLRYRSTIQDCNDRLRMIAECCNLAPDTLTHIEQQEPGEALPLFIENLTEALNSLTEDRIMCLQILRADDEASQESLPSLLKAYIETLKHHAEKDYKETKSKLDSLEVRNKQSRSEMQRLQKAVHKKQDELEKLHNKLKEIKRVTLKKFKEINDIYKEDVKNKNFDEKMSQNVLPIDTKQHSPPSSLHSAPTPVVDQRNDQLSAERLLKLRKKAKYLETSLNDALTKTNIFRKRVRSTKISGRLYGLTNLPEVPQAHKKEMKLMPSPMHMWSTQFETDGPKVHDVELNKIKQQQKEREARKLKAKERRKEALTKSQDVLSNETPPIFRSLVKSLDEGKKNQGTSFKPIGQVKKCLRCSKIFNRNDNHKKACNYHPKGQDRTEKYTDRGKLIKATYVWKCCMMGPDSIGCTYGQHV